MRRPIRHRNAWTLTGAALIVSLLLVSLLVVQGGPGAGQDVPATLRSRTADLESGWNLIGSTATTGIAEAIAGIDGDFETIAAYDPASGQFRSFTPELPGELNRLDTLTLGEGLWIRVAGPHQWIQPEPREPQQIAFTAGFNLVAWLGPNRTPIEEAIGAIATTVRSVWTYDAVDQAFLRYQPGGLAILNQPIVLDYGDGLWLQMAASGVWDQPTPQTVARQWDEELLAAIRIDFPAPTVHSRNLFHLSVAMYDAWAAYDPSASGYLFTEKVATTGMSPIAIEAAREEAISYAAYRLLVSRFDDAIAAQTTLPRLDARLRAIGHDARITTTAGASPVAVGNRVAAAVIAHGLADGANEAGSYADTTGYVPANLPLVFELPGAELLDPNRWQPLAFDFQITQNGIDVGESVQTYIGAHWGGVTPFALTSDGPVSWSGIDPGPPPQLGGADDTAFKQAALAIIRRSSELSPADGVEIDISPATSGNRPLGTHDDTGYATNPVSGVPYVPNVVLRGDYARILAEFWADGPSSETPPGHWNVLANQVSDDPRLQKQLGGAGPLLDDLEWDVKLYVALNGAVHDAAIAAWGSKAVYDYVRPISLIRYLGGLGQSSDPAGPSFHPSGLPLEPGLVEVITAESSQPGARHERLSALQGSIAIFTWSARGLDGNAELGMVDWIPATAWMPYQASTFVTPAFAAYVSGHSTFSRSAAEVLTAFTVSAFFPGGLGTHVISDDFLDFDVGPTREITLQWATYQDAADEAGISRLWGGIHVPADDFAGRIMGERIGRDAFALAARYFDGAITD